MVLIDTARERAMGLGRDWNLDAAPQGTVLLSEGAAAAYGVAVGDVVVVTVNIPWTLRHALAPTPPNVCPQA